MYSERTSTLTAWSAVRLGAILREVRRTGAPERELLSVYLDRGVIRYSDSFGQVHKPSLDLSTYQQVEPGDLVLNNQQAWRGSVGVSTHRGIISPAYVVCRLSPSIDTRFANYLFRSPALVDEYVRASKGIGSIQRNLVMQHLKTAVVSVPSLQEQQLISRYLDNATMGIARAIAAKWSLVDHLEEASAASRWEALVGSGAERLATVDGAEWMGDLPEGFSRTRLKGVLRERTVRSQTGNQVLLSLRRREGLVPAAMYSNRPQVPAALVNYKVVEAGQLVVNRMRATIGVLAVAQESGIVSPDYAVFDVDPTCHAGYLALLLRSPHCGRLIRTYSRGMGTGEAGFLRIYSDELGRIPVALPSYAEQERRYREAQLAGAAFDDAVAALRREIALLGEYRTRLVSDVLSGKRDVRAEAATMSEADPDELQASVAAALSGTAADDEGGDGGD